MHYAKNYLAYLLVVKPHTVSIHRMCLLPPISCFAQSKAAALSGEKTTAASDFDSQGCLASQFPIAEPFYKTRLVILVYCFIQTRAAAPYVAKAAAASDFDSQGLAMVTWAYASVQVNPGEALWRFF
jgi:hypothetical protein